MKTNQANRRWRALLAWNRPLLAALAVVSLCGSCFSADTHPGAAPATPAALMEFFAKNLPHVASDLGRIQQEDPETFRNHLKHAAALKEAYDYYANSDPKLAELFIEIKQREHQEQLKVEEILASRQPAEQQKRFEELHAHMAATYEINLRLVRGELAHLEEAIQGLKKTIQEEEQNKGKNIKSDLKELFSRKAGLIAGSAATSSRPKLAQPPLELQKLIDSLPE